MKKTIFILFLILSIIAGASLVEACEEGQIDVNTASLEKLKTFTGIGDVKAQAIIDARPFESVDNLINVYGVGPATLENMKNEGACVEEKEESKESKEVEIIEENFFEEEPNEKIEEKEPVERKVIALQPKVIKSEETEKSSEKNRYAVYGLFAFSVLIGLLFLLKQRKPKNEFRE